MQPTDTNNQQRNFTPLPQGDNKLSINVKYILLSFAVVFFIMLGGLVLFQLVNQKTQPTMSTNTTSQNGSVSSKQQSDLHITPNPVTPTGIVKSSQPIDNGSPEAINIGTDDASFSDLQKDLQGL